MLLISTYDLGRAPFGLASPAAWIAEIGAEVSCNDLAVEPLDEAAVRAADLVAFHVPMHTATRLAARTVPRVRALQPRAHLCFYGLYAAMNEPYLRALGAATILGGEFEAGLAALVRRLQSGRGDEPQREPVVSFERLRFRPPRRDLLPPIERYARLHLPDGSERAGGYTEASRGCKHRCRHCPIVPVYGGRFRVVPRDVVLEDVRRQVAAGAQHVTFGDPDFLNGPGHALPLVRALHAAHPDLTYDVTIKIEHLVRHAALLPELRATGCVLVTSAAESIDDAVLERLEKHHTRRDLERGVVLSRDAGIALHPTFVPFTPWTTASGYQELLAWIEDMDLVEHVAPIQLAIRLLIPAGSRLLELEDVRASAGPFDPEALVHRWRHPDPAIDGLQREIEAAVAASARDGRGRTATFARLQDLAGRRVPDPAREHAAGFRRPPVPYLSEPWYC